jgi:hypothetical protein
MKDPSFSNRVTRFTMLDYAAFMPYLSGEYSFAAAYNARQGKEGAVDCATMAGVIADALNDVLGADGVDVLPDPSGAFVDIAADGWTLHVEGTPVTVAWLAIDDEPDDPGEIAAARRKAMSTRIDRALADAGKQLNGSLVAALRASRDPLSMDLAVAVSSTES